MMESINKEEQQEQVGEEKGTEGAEGKSIVDLLGNNGAAGEGEQSVMHGDANVSTIDKGIRVGNIYTLNTATTAKVRSQQYPYSTFFSPSAGDIPLNKKDRTSRSSVSIAKGTPIQILKIWKSNYALVKLLGIRAAEFEFVVSTSKINPSPPEFVLTIKSQFFGNLLHSLLKDNKVTRENSQSLELLKQVIGLIIASMNRKIPFEGRDWMKRDIIKFLKRKKLYSYNNPYNKHVKKFAENSFQIGATVATLERKQSRNGIVQINYVRNETKTNVNDWFINTTAFRRTDLFDLYEKKQPKPTLKARTRGYESGAEVAWDIFNLGANAFLFYANGTALAAEVVGAPFTEGMSLGLVIPTATAMFVTGDATVTQIGIIYRKATGTYEDHSRSNHPQFKQMLLDLSKDVTGSEAPGEFIYDFGTFKLGVIRISQSISASRNMLIAGKKIKAVKPATGATLTIMLKLQQLIKMTGK